MSQIQKYIKFDIEVIRPKEFDLSNMRLNLLHEMSAFGDEVIKEYKKTTSYWIANRPEFIKTLDTGGKGGETVVVTISTNSKIYEFLDKGTRAHLENPKPVGSERDGNVIGTWGTFRAGSTPGVLDTAKTPAGVGKIPVPGRYLSLNTTESRSSIPHPGFRARKFSELISEKMTGGSRLQERFQSVLDKSKYYK